MKASTITTIIQVFFYFVLLFILSGMATLAWNNALVGMIDGIHPTGYWKMFLVMVVLRLTWAVHTLQYQERPDYDEFGE